MVELSAAAGAGLDAAVASVIWEDLGEIVGATKPTPLRLQTAAAAATKIVARAIKLEC